MSLFAACGSCQRLESTNPPVTNGGGTSATSSSAIYTSSTGGGSSAGEGPQTNGMDAGADGSGGQSGSSTTSASLTRGPTAAAGGTNFPFPQNRQSSGCQYPDAYSNDAVVAAYAAWKADMVTSNNANGFMRVQRTSSDGVDGCRPLNSTVSEGIGYGMLIAVYMGDPSLFDSLWLYEQQNLDASGLMNWAPNGSGNTCSGGATDADEDMAFALAMADRQWGGQGTLKESYKQSAIDQIQKIWNTEIFNYAWVRAGDGNWATNANQNISYFAPSYYRVFAEIDPKACPQGSDAAYSKMNNCDGWWGVIDQDYVTIGDALNGSNGNASNGLVPGWCDDSTPGQCPAASGQPFTYQYDACRTPFRIGLDWCWNGEGRAQSYLAKINSFFGGIGAANIVDGYALNGTPQPATSAPNGGGAVPLSDPFVGPAAVGAMSGSAYRSLLNDGYGLLAKSHPYAGGEYYASSWRVLSLLMMTGNFVDYTQETAAH